MTSLSAGEFGLELPARALSRAVREVRHAARAQPRAEAPVPAPGADRRDRHHALRVRCPSGRWRGNGSILGTGSCMYESENEFKDVRCRALIHVRYAFE